MLTFRPFKNADSGMDVEWEPKLLTNQFGDGYRQEMGDGINNDQEPYSPEWTNAKYDEAMYIINFIKARKGTEPFLWQPNGESVTKVFKCKRMNRRWKSGKRCDISCVFEEVGRV